jgi:preprotein translocase subunit SecY
MADTGVPKVGVRPGAASTTRLKEMVDAVALFASVTVAVIAKVPD